MVTMTQDQKPENAYEVDGELLTEDQYRERVSGQAEAVRAELVAMRDDWIRHRAQSGVESRWRRAAKLYFGEGEQESEFVETLKTGPTPKAQQPVRSRVTINIVRPKVDQAVARMCEILLPVDDRNWGIKPTPVPTTIKSMLGNPAPTVVPGTSTPTGMTADEEARAVVQAAKESAEAMQEEIDDALTECRYNAEQRSGIEDGVRLGTMVLKGPFPARQTSKTWQPVGDGKQQIVHSSTVVPASARRDPWDIWFDPACGNDHQRGQGVWERRYATRKDLRALVDLPGYDADAIRQVLSEVPNRVQVAEGRVTRAPQTREKSYEIYEFHGEIEPGHMALCSMNTGDPLEDVDFGVIVMCNDRVIGALPSWVPDKTLPYDVWNWRQADDSPYGFGLPDEMEHQQRVVNAAWRQVMDNARLSSGSQFVMFDFMQPADNRREVTPNKAWICPRDKIDDINKAFATFDIPSHLSELLAIAEAAMKYSDQETSMPQLMGGENGTAPETVGGMVMLYNNANAVLRLRVKLYDDNITTPHIGRHYDWQMAHNPKASIKGDFEVDARGSSALLEKDIQNQATLNLSNVTSNPRYQPFLDPKEELKVVLKAFKVQPQDIMLSDDQIKKNEENPAPAPADPRIEAAKIKAEVDMQKLADQKEVRALTEKQIEYNKQREQGEFDIAMTEASINRDSTLLKLEADQRMAADATAAKERLTLLEIDTKRQLFNAEAALKTQMGQGI